MFELADYLGVYGPGMENPGHGYAEGFGNTGQLHGYMTWAGCLPEEGVVIVVLTNHRSPAATSPTPTAWPARWSARCSD